MWVRWSTEAAPVLHHPPLPVGLVRLIGLALRVPVADEALTAELKPLLPLPGDWLGVRGSLSLEALLGLPKPLAPSVPGGELVASRLPVELVLGGVDPSCLGNDLPAIRS